MSRKSLFLLFLVLILTGCFQTIDGVSEQPFYERELVIKNNITTFFQSHPHPININSNYTQVFDWFNENTVIYLTEDDDHSILRLHNFDTGEQEEFFISNDPILDVISNEDNSLYAISVAAVDNDVSPLYIVDDSGTSLFEIFDIGDEYSVYWNPYHKDQLLIVSYLTNWEFELYHLFVKDGNLKKVDIDQTYLQWVDEKTIAYLNWDWNEPSFKAPLVFYNLSTEEKEQFIDDIIAFFTYSNHLVITLSVNSIYDLNTKYSFYKNDEKISETEIPILDTYSEQWWIPFHDYHVNEDMFFYFRPQYSGSFIDYHDPFELVSFHIEDEVEEIITEVEEQLPIKISPNGKWLLYGQQNEYLINIENKNLYPLIVF